MQYFVLYLVRTDLGSAEYNIKEALIMTEKEFRKLKALDLIQMLLTQSNEVSGQQEELDLIDVRLESLHGENEVIKAKLNDRDAMTELIKQKLNESDERIHELEKEVKSLYSDRIIELEEAGSLVQAALELNKIFEAAQKEAERYMNGAERGIEGRRYHAVGMTDRIEEPRHIKAAAPARRQQPGTMEKAMAKELMTEESIAEKLKNEESIVEKLKNEESITIRNITEEIKKPEPAAEPVKMEDPPGLEAFNWRLDEEQPQVDHSAPGEAAQKEADPPKEPTETKPKGLFSWLFGRRKK